MSKIIKSRGPEVDVQKCVEAVGGNRFEPVLIAAAHARELGKQHNEPKMAVQALLDIQNKKLNQSR